MQDDSIDWKSCVYVQIVFIDGAVDDDDGADVSLSLR